MTKDDEFFELLQDIPKPGDNLESLYPEGTEFIRDGKKIYTRAIVSIDATPGWYLHDDKKGIIIMIQETDHKIAVGRVTKVKIIRVSNSGNCLVAKILETV